jgi:serine/threonine-protein phosphatase Stp1
MRHVLTNVVGARDVIDLKVMSRPLIPGETFLLASDGLHVELDLGTMAGILGSSPDVRAAAERLVEAALRGAAKDNITALVVRHGDA